MRLTPHPSCRTDLTPAVLNASVGSPSIPEKSQGFDDVTFVKERVFEALLEQVPALATDTCGSVVV